MLKFQLFRITIYLLNVAFAILLLLLYRVHDHLGWPYYITIVINCSYWAVTDFFITNKAKSYIFKNSLVVRIFIFATIGSFLILLSCLTFKIESEFFCFVVLVINYVVIFELRTSVIFVNDKNIVSLNFSRPDLEFPLSVAQSDLKIIITSKKDSLKINFNKFNRIEIDRLIEDLKDKPEDVKWELER